MSVRPIIRDATPADAAAIAEVQVAAWKLAYRGMLPDATLRELTVQQRAISWQKILADYPRATFVSVLGSMMTGWIGFGKSRDDDRPALSGEVYGLYVTPGHWRSGHGTTLWWTAVERLTQEGFRSVDVWVLEANERARRFYESVGCLLDKGAGKMFEGDGFSVPEVRYSLAL